MKTKPAAAFRGAVHVAGQVLKCGSRLARKRLSAPPLLLRGRLIPIRECAIIIPCHLMAGMRSATHLGFSRTPPRQGFPAREKMSGNSTFGRHPYTSLMSLGAGHNPSHTIRWALVVIYLGPSFQSDMLVQVMCRPPHVNELQPG